MCGRLVNLDTVARVLAEYYHLKTETQLAALDEALSKVPAVSVGGGHGKDHVADPGKMVGDLISRQAALDIYDDYNVAVENGELEAYGKHRKRLLELPSAQPVAKDTNVPAKDCISRQWLMECVEEGWIKFDTEKDENRFIHLVRDIAPPAQSPKEIPKRVFWSGWKGYRDTRYKCPNCEKPVRNDDHYCHRCGQRLMFPHISFTDYVPGQKQDVIVRWDDE